MRYTLIALFFILSFTGSVFGQKGSVQIECFSCEELKANDCESCTSSSIKKYFKGLLVTSPQGKQEIDLPFSVVRSGQSVRLTDYEGDVAVFNRRDTEYRTISALMDAINACNCQGGGGSGGGDVITSFSYNGRIASIVTDMGTFPATIDASTLQIGAPITVGATTFPSGTAIEDVLEAMSNSFVSSFTVNAGTTATPTDDANGQEVISDGDIIHFWSPDGSIEFTVTPGSVVIGGEVAVSASAGNVLVKNADGLFVSASASGVSSVVGGTNVTVDATDAANPIVNVPSLDDSDADPTNELDTLFDVSGNIIINGGTVLSPADATISYVTPNQLSDSLALDLDKDPTNELDTLFDITGNTIVSGGMVLSPADSLMFYVTPSQLSDSLALDLDKDPTNELPDNRTGATAPIVEAGDKEGDTYTQSDGTIYELIGGAWLTVESPALAGHVPVTVTNSASINQVVSGTDNQSIYTEIVLDPANGGMAETANGLLFNPSGANTFDPVATSSSSTTLQDAISEALNDPDVDATNELPLVTSGTGVPPALVGKIGDTYIDTTDNICLISYMSDGTEWQRQNGNPVRYFDTKTQLKGSELKNGQYGYVTSVNAYYLGKATNDSGHPSDDIAVITTSNGFAILQDRQGKYLFDWFDPDPTGSTESTLALTTALNYGNATGHKTIEYTEGADYVMDGDTEFDVSGFTFLGVGAGSKITAGLGYTGFKSFLAAKGTVGAYSAIAVDVDSMTFSLTVGAGDIANFSTGDMVSIVSTDYFNVNLGEPATPGTYTGASRKGEIKIIQSISGNVLTFENMIFDNYAAATSSIAVVTPGTFYMENIEIDNQQDSTTTDIAGIELEWCSNAQIVNCTLRDFKPNLLINNCYRTYTNTQQWSYQAPTLNIGAASTFTTTSGVYYLDNSEVEVIGNGPIDDDGACWETLFINLDIHKNSDIGEVLDTHIGVGSVTYDHVRVWGGRVAFSQGAQNVTIKDCEVYGGELAIQTRDELTSLDDGSDFFSLPTQRFYVDGVNVEGGEEFISFRKDQVDVTIRNVNHNGSGYFLRASIQDSNTVFKTLVLRDLVVSDGLITGEFKVPILDISNVTSYENEYTTSANRFFWISGQSVIGEIKVNNLTYYRRGLSGVSPQDEWFYLSNDALIEDRVSFNNLTYDIELAALDGDKKMFFSNSTSFFPDFYMSNSYINDQNGNNRMFFSNGDTEGTISLIGNKINRNSSSFQFGMTGQFLVNIGNELTDDLDPLIGNFITLMMTSGSYIPGTPKKFMSGTTLVGDNTPEGVVTAERGTFFVQSNANNWYRKTGGGGDNTGWVTNN